ncbi:hypothetical protein F2Q70_00013641 [Brassica cretica]|uniref:Uncharacterized protein n=2 Tax=Brassica cretica TaxID=69181 RepID=A0A8S9J6Q5_BRACR|nr:hypothetical protein F2Q68_00006671 [Brassica cretica]KAF2612252.1 hypothetical protein F2Q70_00013641 [Brassica cretica]KAF3544137.1 hypothetical protein DY000_02010248 [Brassica cretica]
MRGAKLSMDQRVKVVVTTLVNNASVTTRVHHQRPKYAIAELACAPQNVGTNVATKLVLACI